MKKPATRRAKASRQKPIFSLSKLRVFNPWVIWEKKTRFWVLAKNWLAKKFNNLFRACLKTSHRCKKAVSNLHVIKYSKKNLIKLLTKINFFLTSFAKKSKKTLDKALVFVLTKLHLNGFKKLPLPKKIPTISILVFVLGVGSFFLYQKLTLAVSATKTVTSQADWEAGEYYPGALDTKTTAGNLAIKSGSVGAWDAGTPGFAYDNAGYDYWTYDGNSYGAGMATDGTYIYQIVGNRRPYLFRFNPETNTWKQLANAPTSFYYGGAITYDAYSKALFAIDGGDAGEITNTDTATKHLFKYDIATDTWSKLADAPDIWTLGSVLTSDAAGKIYAMRSYYSAQLPDAFWVYTQGTNSWNDTLPNPQVNYSSTNGQSLLFVNETYGENCTTGCVFALGGGSTANFFRYDIAENQWYSAVTGMGNAGYGASLAYDSTNGNIFMHNGNAGGVFSKYDVSAATWYLRVTFSGGGGSEADGYATISGGAVTGVTIRHGGRGYTSAPTVAFAGGGGASAAGTAVVTNNAVSSVSMTNNGSGYTLAAAPPDSPGVVSYGGSMAYIKINGVGYIYQTRGYATPDLWRYRIDDPGGNVWESIDTPTTNYTTGNGGEDGLMVYVATGVNQCADASGCLFTLRGGNTNTFWRFNIGAKTWTSMNSTNLGNIQWGGSTCKAGNYLYAILGGATVNVSNDLYRFDLTSATTGGDAWVAMTDMPTTDTAAGSYPANPTPAYIGYGGNIACLGTSVYATKGYAWQTGTTYNYSNHFLAFDGASWSQLTVTPQRMGHGGATVGVPNSGSCADATGCIFALMGNQRGDWYRYNISAATWTQLTDIPTATYYTATLAYDGSGNIYAISGDFDRKVWRYSISGNSWTRVADFPGKAGYNNALAYDTAANVIYARNGMGLGSIYKFTPTTNDYISSTTWVSEPLDLTNVSSFTNLSASETLNGNSIDYYSRTSSDKVTWSDWAVISGGSISSAAARYVQIKAVLNSASGASTPVLTSLTINYEKEGTDPVNPTISGYANTSETPTLTSGYANGYYYTNPYFKLSGATDTGGSGVTGYYVLWSNNAGDDPAGSENYYQTGTTYEINANLTSGTTYYLLVKTKDVAGNVSDSAASFTYIYNGIASASTTAWTANATFDQTGQPGFSSTNVDLTANSNTDMTLSSVSPGTWMDLPAVASNNALTGYSAYNDSSIAWDGNDTIYFLRSINTQTFSKYTISTKLWASLTNTGANAQYGSAIVYVPPNISAGCADASGCIYATMGGAGTGFRRYNIGANTWDAMTAVSGSVGYGGGLIYPGNGDYIYATRGAGQLNFYRYTISTGTWADRASVEGAFNYGASYAYVPNGTYCADTNGCIFATRGAGTNHFLRYDISANSWGYLTAPPSASPVKGNYGAAMTFNNGFLYFIAGYASTDFLKYDIANDLWSTLADLPATHYYGSTNAMVFDTSTNTIYTPRMYNEYSFISYDVTNNAWRNPAIPHGQSSNGFYYGGMAYDGTDTIYVARGNATNDFYKYTVSTQAWQRMNDVPIRMYTGSDLIYVGGYVYALGGTPPNSETSTRFYRYDPTTDLWARLNDTPASVNYGATLVFDGVDTIYTARGVNTTTYYSYDISLGTWSTQGSVIPGAVYQGGCAVRGDGAYTGYIYQIRATNTRNIYRCALDTSDPDASTCTWSVAGTLTDAPASPGNLYYGGACTVSNGKIFVPRGNSDNTNLLVYDIATDSWDSSRSLNNFYYYGRLMEGPNDILYGFRGYNTSTMDRYVQQSSTMSFQRIGTWISQVVDLGSVYDFGGLTVNDSLGAANTSMKYETRTCSDAGCATDANDAHWSAWDEVSGLKTVSTTDYYNVDSTVARYFQLKVTFTSDRIYTPTANDFTLSYYTDSTAPNNPSVPVSGYTDSGKGTGISNDTWTNDATPYFEWTSTDNVGGIGINGYYVYFGTDITKDPVTDASDATNLAYKTGTNYYSATDGTGSWNALTQSASALTDNTYYLRIKTKDHNNNVTAAAVDAFTYKIDVSSPNLITDLTVASYMLSTDTFSFSWTEPVDVGPSGVAQYCYHTGSSADTCVAKATICSGGTCTVSPVAHYQARANTFYARARDTANNDAASYASTNYFYTGPAPTAPASITVDPTSRVDNNTFTISWSLPGTCLGASPCAAADLLRYCYTINEVPGVSNCGTFNVGGSTTPSPDGGWTTELQTSGRQLSSFSAATQQGTNTVYVVAMDAVGNINYDNYASQTYTFTSNAPGVPVGLTATDSSDRAASRYSITLTWDEPVDLGSGVESYKVYRCTTDCENPSTVDDPPANYTSIAEVNTLGYLDTSLSNTTTYTYFARATGTGATISGNSALVSMKPEGKFKAAPAMSGNPETSIRIRSAEISWLTQDDVDNEGNAVSHPATSFVQYGTTTAYGSETGTSDLVKEHEVTLTDLTPNTVYHYKLKWVDIDGNVGYSTDYSLTTLGAPSAPTGVTVTPSSGTTNSFAFSWTAPADEGVTVASYRYSVNSTPTADNTTLTTSTSVTAFAAATRQGSNTFYVVAIDDGGNVNYANYGSVDFTTYTTPPDPPKNITLVDSSNRDAKRYSLTLTWDPPTVSATGDWVRAQALESNTIYYTIYRSMDGTNFSEIATITSTGYLDTGLDNSQTYSYKIIAKDKAQASSSETAKMAAIPQGRFTSPPAISQEPNVTPDSFAATVAWQTEREASSFVEFGTSKDKLNIEQGKAEQAENHSIKITGLKAETVYYYRIKSLDIDQNTAYSEISSFTTLEAPRVTNVKIKDIRLYDATIIWETTKESSAVIEYGTTTNYGLTYSDTSGSFASKHTVKLENLKDGTTYHIRLEGQDRSGNPISSDDYNFTTLTFPKVLTVASQNKAEGQTEIKWKTNVPTTSEVEYYNETSPSKTQGNTSLVTDHAVLLFGLEDATEYKFKVHGRDQFGFEAVSTENKFKTLEDTTPPVISGVQSESNTVGSGDAAKIQIIVSWKTNEPTTSQVQYGEGLASAAYSAETDENAERVREHLMVISGLTPAKTYHFRVVSKDKAGNMSKSNGYSILTSRSRQSFLQIVIGNLEDTFSWLGNIGKLVK